MSLLALALWAPLALASAQGPAAPPPIAGIGAAIKEQGGRFLIEALVPGGPAAENGRLKPGDAIEAVAQAQHPFAEVEGMLLEQVVALIRGRPDTTVRVRVARADPEGRKEEVTVSLTRRPLGAAAAIPARPKEDAPPASPVPLPPAAPLTPQEKRNLDGQL